MVFTHDTTMSLHAAAVLANSALTGDNRNGDTLTTVVQLDAFYAEYSYTGAHAGDTKELESVRALRGPLRELLTAGRDDAVRIVNRMLAEHDARPQLVRHDGWDYHLHATDPATPLADRIAVETAMAMVDVIRADELDRLSICADDTCDGVVVDLSRNRSRRFCSTACGNRVAAAAYRARRSG